MKVLAFLDQKIVNSILAKVSKPQEMNKLKLISFFELFNFLDESEKNLVKSFLKMNPGDFGFKGKFLGIGAIPKNMKNINGQYLPGSVLSAFLGMNEAMEEDIGKKLKIFSGYRSPAYQVIVFLRCLKDNKFDFLRTVKGVAFPGYSEHGDPVNLAIDVCATNGTPSKTVGPKSFEKTREYRWLLQNANKYGFYLSYPKDNKDGVMFEPWHWRLKG